MTMRRPIIGGNWKMNTDLASGRSLAAEIASAAATPACDIVLYPPFPYLQQIGEVIAEGGVVLGAQNMWHEESGAFTGEVSGAMLRDLGVRSVLVGHSERRHVVGESHELIAAKAAAVIAAELQLVLCVSETLDQREDDRTLDIVLGQVDSGLSSVGCEAMGSVVIAYEPVWAIGTGRTASPGDAQAVHAAIRSHLQERYDAGVAAATRIQYGGSVNDENAGDLLACPDIDGALVGGASLNADSFSAIIAAAVTKKNQSIGTQSR